MVDLMLPALLAGISIAIIAGPLGSFIVWRRMSYFADTLSHSALLGIAFGILFDINLSLTVLIACVFLAIVLVLFQKNKTLSNDTILGILAHSTLAVGLVMTSFASDVEIDLESYLLGNILEVSQDELIWIILGCITVLIILFVFWEKLLTIAIHEELAQVEGLGVVRIRLLLTVLVAIFVAVAINIVGLLLVTSLLIIPPAAARRFANTPEQMAFGATLLGCFSVIIGLYAGSYWQTPIGPSIVVVATICFGICYSLPRK